MSTAPVSAYTINDFFTETEVAASALGSGRMSDLAASFSPLKSTPAYKSYYHKKLGTAYTFQVFNNNGWVIVHEHDTFGYLLSVSAITSLGMLMTLVVTHNT